MKLLPVIKKLRAKFPDFKVRQLTDFYNRIYALIVLPECEYEMTLTFEYEYGRWNNKPNLGISGKSFFWVSNVDFTFNLPSFNIVYSTLRVLDTSLKL